MITTWTVFLVVAISFILLVMVLLFLLFRKFKMKTGINVIVTLIVGLIVGGGAFGFVSSTQGTHFVVINEDLSTEVLYSLGENEYERANGEKVTIKKMESVLINETGKELAFEEVVYGYGKEPTFDIIDENEVYSISCLPASIYFFENEPPASVELKNGQTVSKYWVTLLTDDEG